MDLSKFVHLLLLFAELSKKIIKVRRLVESQFHFPLMSTIVLTKIIQFFVIVKIVLNSWNSISNYHSEVITSY